MTESRSRSEKKGKSAIISAPDELNLRGTAVLGLFDILGIIQRKVFRLRKK